MKTLTTIQSLCNIAPFNKNVVVEFLEKINMYETCIDPGMRAVFVKGELENGEDSVYCLTFDFSKFMEYNKPFFSHNYYDKNGNPVLTSVEAGYWPKNNIETLFISDSDEPIDSVLRIVSENALMDEYFLDKEANGNYTQWLEEKLVNCRKELEAATTKLSSALSYK